jgi:hypothetical protein
MRLSSAYPAAGPCANVGREKIMWNKPVTFMCRWRGVVFPHGFRHSFGSILHAFIDGQTLRDWNMMRRALTCGIVLGLALLATGCAKKDRAIERLDGAEPQRISFGDPVSVQSNFSEKMRVCWSQSVLQGYRFEARSATEGEGPPGPVIRVYPENAPAGQASDAFQIEFHPYNDNTLISTRNLTMPLEVASRMKRDIETWIFGSKGCGDQHALVLPGAYRSARI